MALSDKTMVCVECGSEFIFTVGEQEFFQARGFGNEPKRCRSCRAVRRTEQRGGGGGGGGGGGMYQDGPREMYPMSARNAVTMPWSRSGPGAIARSTAATASAVCGKRPPPASSLLTESDLGAAIDGPRFLLHRQPLCWRLAPGSKNCALWTSVDSFFPLPLRSPSKPRFAVSLPSS